MLGSRHYYKPEFEHYLREMLDPSDPYKNGSEVLSRMLDMFINDKILEISVQEKGLTLAPGELDQVEARIQLADKSSTPSDTWLQKLKMDLLADKFIRQYLAAGIGVTSDEIASYYQSHQDLFKMPDRFKAHEIVLYDREEAARTRKQLQGKNLDQFAEIARQVSKSASAERGGDMGILRNGQIPPEMETAILQLQPGQISPVVQTPYGFHIFILEAKLPAELLPLDTVRANIEREILQGKIRKRADEFLREKRQTMPLKIIKRNLGFEYVDEEVKR